MCIMCTWINKQFKLYSLFRAYAFSYTEMWLFKPAEQRAAFWRLYIQLHTLKSICPLEHKPTKPPGFPTVGYSPHNWPQTSWECSPSLSRHSLNRPADIQTNIQVKILSHRAGCDSGLLLGTCCRSQWNKSKARPLRETHFLLLLFWSGH